MNNVNAVKTYAQLSDIMQAIREDKINEVEAILALQIGSEAQLKTLQSINGMPHAVRALPITQLIEISKMIEGLAVEDAPAVDVPEMDEDAMIPHENDDPSRRVWVIVRADNNSGFLTGVRGENISNAGQLCFPGGHPLIDQSSAKGAQMELEEETGMKLPLKAFQSLGWVEKKGIKHEFFLVQVNSAAHARELGLSDTEELGSFRFWQVSGLRQAVERDVAHKSIKRYIDLRDYGAGTVL